MLHCDAHNVNIHETIKSTLTKVVGVVRGETHDSLCLFGIQRGRPQDGGSLYPFVTHKGAAGETTGGVLRGETPESLVPLLGYNSGRVRDGTLCCPFVIQREQVLRRTLLFSLGVMCKCVNV